MYVFDIQYTREFLAGDGPAGAFAQKYTVIPNSLSDNKLYGHRKVSYYHMVVSDCTVKWPENPFNQSKMDGGSGKSFLSERNRNFLFECALWSIPALDI